MFGATLRMRLSPAIAGYSIWLESDNHRYWNDRILQDSDTVPMGARAYHLPPIWGLNSTDY